MTFDPTTITSGPTSLQKASHELRVSWNSSAPAGTTFQLYLDKRLAWSGTATSVVLPLGPARRRIWVGSVGAGEGSTDFSSTLADPMGDGDRASLAWYGGRYLDPTLASFAVYAGATPGAAVGSAPIDSVGATSHGTWADGFGRGRFGRGGFGHAEVAYTWTSGPLSAGTWEFAVAPVDAAGNVGSPSPTSVTIAAPPRPPAPLGPGKGRLAYAYAPSTRTLTLSWNPSPE